MTLLDYPLDARFRSIEDRLVAIERDLGIIRVRVEELDKRIPSPWLLLGLILPLYGVLLLGFAGLMYFLLNFVPHK
jgi:hypothetical protein